MKRINKYVKPSDIHAPMYQGEISPAQRIAIKTARTQVALARKFHLEVEPWVTNMANDPRV